MLVTKPGLTSLFCVVEQDYKNIVPINSVRILSEINSVRNQTFPILDLMCKGFLSKFQGYLLTSFILGKYLDIT